MQILILEDDDRIAELMCTLLDLHGHRAIAVSSATEAREVLGADSTIDVVFADRGLKEHERGDEVLSWLATERPRILRILMSGIERPGDGSGDYVFLLKPLGKDKILGAIDRARQRQQTLNEQV